MLQNLQNVDHFFQNTQKQIINDAYQPRKRECSAHKTPHRSVEMRLMTACLGSLWRQPLWMIKSTQENKKQVTTSYLKQMHMTMFSCVFNVVFFIQVSRLSNNNHLSMRMRSQLSNYRTVEIYWKCHSSTPSIWSNSHKPKLSIELPIPHSYRKGGECNLQDGQGTWAWLLAVLRYILIFVQYNIFKIWNFTGE